MAYEHTTKLYLHLWYALTSQHSLKSPIIDLFFQCLFEPRVIEFDQKRAGCRPFSLPDVTDEIVGQTADHVVSIPESIDAHCKS